MLLLLLLLFLDAVVARVRRTICKRHRSVYVASHRRSSTLNSSGGPAVPRVRSGHRSGQGPAGQHLARLHAPSSGAPAARTELRRPRRPGVLARLPAARACGAHGQPLLPRKEEALSRRIRETLAALRPEIGRNAALKNRNSEQHFGTWQDCELRSVCEIVFVYYTGKCAL